jgi:pimeloyl-ACP methyl ester carboxylesterase
VISLFAPACQLDNAYARLLWASLLTTRIKDGPRTKGLVRLDRCRRACDGVTSRRVLPIDTVAEEIDTVAEDKAMLARIVAVALTLILSPSFIRPLHAELIMRPSPVTVEVRPGVTIKYLALAKPKTTPVNAVMLFAGGNGLLNLQPNGAIGTNLSGNFLVRSRDKFVQKYLFVAVVDTPNQVAIDGNVRLSAQYAQDIAHVIADVRSRIKGGKVWLVGTSTGTMSAASVAARLPLVTPPAKDNLRRADGIVLTSTQTTMVKGYCGRTVFDARLSAVNVPAFIASHLADACACSPPKTSAKVMAALTGAPAKQNVPFSGGLPPKSKDPCMAMTPHGFLGIEDAVVDAIADWVGKH